MPKLQQETDERPALPETKPLTPVENLILTAKILGGGGALVAAIWAVDHYVL